MIPRLFVDTTLTPGTAVTLPDGAAHHVRDVLRLAAGDGVTLLNGLGGEFQARLTVVARKSVEAEVEAFSQRDSEAPYPVTVAQALASGDKMDWVVEKTVELGAVAIEPVAAARSLLRLAGERADKRVAHWRAIARAACEQCGRNRLPAIAPIDAFDRWVAAQRDRLGMKLMLSPVHPAAFSSLEKPAPGTPITLLIGPEAGLTDAEEALAVSAGFAPILLGPRVMRTETAALAALAAIHARWGDF